MGTGLGRELLGYAWRRDNRVPVSSMFEVTTLYPANSPEMLQDWFAWNQAPEPETPTGGGWLTFGFAPAKPDDDDEAVIMLLLAAML